MDEYLSVTSTLSADGCAGTLVGRVWLPGAPAGPAVVAIRDGGVFDLVYRDWVPSDILPGDPKSAAQKQYEFGIGPGCSNAATGQAVPPVRVKEVCESLNIPDDPNTPDIDGELRCCIESICDTDFSNAINCLAGILQDQLIAPG